MAQLIKPNGETTEVQPKNGTDFQLQELYALLDCTCIDIQRLDDGRLMVLDDEGKLKPDWEERKNEKATQLFMEGRMSAEDFKAYLEAHKAKGVQVIMPSDTDIEIMNSVVGTVLVCDPEQIE